MAHAPESARSVVADPHLLYGSGPQMSHPTDRDHVTLFRGAADNSYFELYFNALPSPRAENVRLETHEVDLKPDREVTLHAEIFTPTGKVPLLVTPGGMGECDGFRGFARNGAAASSELRVIIWDRRNMGRPEVSSPPWGPVPSG